MAVLSGDVLVDVKYQILLLPPDALNVMDNPGQISDSVPAFKGGTGFGKACAFVPVEGKLSQPALIQVANTGYGMLSFSVKFSRAPVPIRFRCSSYHCVV